MLFNKNKNTQKISSHKSHKKLWIFGSIAFVFVILPLLVLGWLGFVPGLSDIMGAKNARDLGVRYSQTDYEKYKHKAGIQFKNYEQAPIDPTTNEKTLLGDIKQANQLEFTQQELTAAINSITWDWFPVKNSQVRLSEGAIEISGYVNSANLQNFGQYISDAGNTSNNVSGAIDWTNRFAHDIPFYAKANASALQNKLKFRLTDLQIGRLTVPLGSLGDDLQNGVDVEVGESDMMLSSLKLSEGKVTLTGTYPSTIYVKQ